MAKTTDPQVTGPDGKALADCTLADLARLTRADWANVYFGAVPYLDAMECLTTIDQMYGLDSGHDVVVYFLRNANAWRGPVARQFKAELKKRCRWT